MTQKQAHIAYTVRRFLDHFEYNKTAPTPQKVEAWLRTSLTVELLPRAERRKLAVIIKNTIGKRWK